MSSKDDGNTGYNQEIVKDLQSYNLSMEISCSDSKPKTTNPEIYPFYFSNNVKSVTNEGGDPLPKNVSNQKTLM